MSETISSDDFRKASGLWATGVSIVTTLDTSGKAYGLTMNSVTSLSLDPPLYIVNLDKGSDTLVALETTQVFCINVLASEQQELSNKFAKKGPDKFDGVDYSGGFREVPCINGALMNIQCSVHEMFDGGDHKIVIGKSRKLFMLIPRLFRHYFFTAENT